ncbi:uncharacterized protein DS421_12g387120 [Arachis hypogaea]|nr:uncharacterized protein DS421_12g387120 [Arachis hypogaea]
MDREKAATLSSLLVLGLVAGVTVVAVEAAASEGNIAVAEAHCWCSPKLPPPLPCFTAVDPCLSLFVRACSVAAGVTAKGEDPPPPLFCRVLHRRCWRGSPELLMLHPLVSFGLLLMWLQ